MWGSSEEIEEAKSQLNDLVNRLLGFPNEHEQNRRYERVPDKKNKIQKYESEPVPDKNKQEFELKRNEQQEFELKRREQQEFELKRREQQEFELKRKEQEFELKRKEEQEFELKRKEEQEFELKYKEEQEFELKYKEEREFELKRREQELELKHKEEQEIDEKIYLNLPYYLQRFPFNEYFIFPTTDIPISHFLGPNDEILNSVRVKYRCHIWHDSTLPGSNVSIINSLIQSLLILAKYI
jgi:hypothetical protein